MARPTRPRLEPPRIARRLLVLVALLTWSPLCDLFALLAYGTYIVAVSPLLLFALLAGAVGAHIATPAMNWILLGLQRLSDARDASLYYPLADLATLLGVPDAISRSDPFDA